MITRRKFIAGSAAVAAGSAIAGPVGFRLPGGFTDPRSIGGLKLWLDASQIVGLNDGDAVGTWVDLSGNGNDVTQATGSAKPTFETNELNGKPTLRFDGVDDYLTCVTFSLTQPMTVLCVARLDDVAGDYRRIIDGGTSRVIIGKQVGDLIFFAGSLAPLYARARPWPWKYYTSVFNGASSQQFENSTSLGTANPGTQALTNLSVGCGFPQGLAEFWAGDIAEIIIYNSSLSAGQLGMLHSYLSSKYAI